MPSVVEPKNVTENKYIEKVEAEIVEDTAIIEEEIIEDAEIIEEEIIEEEIIEDVEVEGEASEEEEAALSLEERINEELEKNGYTYVYNGEILDTSKLQIHSNTYIIYNTKTGTPFIYSGEVIKYGDKKEAITALETLRMFTSNPDLVLIDFKELKGKSIL